MNTHFFCGESIGKMMNCFNCLDYKEKPRRKPYTWQYECKNYKEKNNGVKKNNNKKMRETS